MGNKKYTAIAAILRRIEENNETVTIDFSDEAITMLAKTALNKPVYNDFNYDQLIGKVISAKNDNGNLLITFEVIDDNIITTPKSRLVPAYTSEELINKKPEDRITINKAESICYAFTDFPADKNLPEIKEGK